MAAEKTAYRVLKQSKQPDDGDGVWLIVAENVPAHSGRGAVNAHATKADGVQVGDVFAAVPVRSWTVIPVEDVETQTVVKLGEAA